MKLCHKMKVYGRGNHGKARPEIRLLGFWLAKLGFEIGSEIAVTILDDKLLIEKSCDTTWREEENFKDLKKFFGKPEKSQVLNWIKQKGGIKSNTVSIDTLEMKEIQKANRLRGKNSVIRKNGSGLDTLCQEAQWEGIIGPEIETDQFAEMVLNQMKGGKQNG